MARDEGTAMGRGLDRLPDEFRALADAAGLKHVDLYAGPLRDGDDDGVAVRHQPLNGDGNPFSANGNGSASAGEEADVSELPAAE